MQKVACKAVGFYSERKSAPGKIVWNYTKNRPHVSVSSSSTIRAHRAVDSAPTTARFQPLFQTPSEASLKGFGLFKKRFGVYGKRIRAFRENVSAFLKLCQRSAFASSFLTFLSRSEAKMKLFSFSLVAENTSSLLPSHSLCP